MPIPVVSDAFIIGNLVMKAENAVNKMTYESVIIVTIYDMEKQSIVNVYQFHDLQEYEEFVEGILRGPE